MTGPSAGQFGAEAAALSSPAALCVWYIRASGTYRARRVRAKIVCASAHVQPEAKPPPGLDCMAGCPKELKRYCIIISVHFIDREHIYIGRPSRHLSVNIRP